MTRDGLILQLEDRIRYWEGIRDSIDSMRDDELSKVAETMGIRFKAGKGYGAAEIRDNMRGKCGKRLETLYTEADRMMLRRAQGVEDRKHEGAGGRA